MTFLSILTAVAAAVLLLLLTPLRLNAAYKDGVFTLSGQAGPLTADLLPRKKRAKKPRGRGARRRIEPAVLRMAAECGCRAAGRLLRGARIYALWARYTAGGSDPADAVMAYARAGVAMEGIAAAVDCADLRADVDFDAGRSRFEGRIGISARLGTVLAAAFCFGIAFLRRYYQYKREKE